jgi:hypothetical protein
VPLTLPFRRKPAEPLDESPEETSAASSAAAKTRGYTPSKRELGHATPKRRQGGRPAEPPPANRKEALKRMRAKERESRAEARAGMLAGDERYLPARDKGPERSLVRDIVDARRNAASYFLPGALLVIVFSSQAWPATITLAANIFWMLLAIAVILDSFLLTRRLKKVLPARFPKATLPPRKHYFYAIMRAFQIRRFRLPAPKVKLGEKV